MNFKLLISKMVFVTLVAMIVMCGCGDNEPQLVDLSQQTSSEKHAESEYVDGDDGVTSEVNERKPDEIMICVHISGAVMKPGLYELPEGSRLYDAVMEAGGFSTDAAVDYANLAEVLLDGVKYHIYTNSEIEDMDAGSGTISLESHYNSAGQLNINLATKEELMNLSGIGEAKALAIIEYRETQGAFKSVEELKNVSGIGEGLFTKISGDIIVN